ncbi:Peptidase M3:Neutral zinc metallopeptidases, zinc-binding region [Fulvimarina pelagi HTCC2506]|uniref:Peptidase M3:Neutral zinc metallopeptidases, zinc-binding region n=1 Tax=Fulvimarina pelagi HTCC2506 TaxID=314231 RepID=Q0G5J5_9HYPH|nr:M3 family metallopeptidase [Fulvimarina pelagi]EAU43069.1 Peptidase M3:Neutral zinc metallopeptidases, zinc-binding region [Fulvimarina pelagi HTCC2506]
MSAFTYEIHDRNTEEFRRLLSMSAKKSAGNFEQAFFRAIEDHAREIAAISEAREAPSFTNTIRALEASGASLSEVSRAFAVLAGTSTTPELQALERKIYPVLSRHFSAISLDPKLFGRVEAVAKNVNEMAEASPQARRLTARMYKRMMRAGAMLDKADRDRLADIEARLSELFTAFAQNILADENAWFLELGDDDLAGLPAWLVSSLQNAGAERDKAGAVLTLSRSLIVPFLQMSERADLRSVAFEAWTRRGENVGPSDNRPIMAEILKLRTLKARLLGFETYAAFKLEDQMAKSPDQVRDLLMRVWKPARARAAADAAILQSIAENEGVNRPLAPADWRYYAEKRRRAELDFDETALKPYFSLDRMIAAAFDVANRLFGLTFEPVSNLPIWNDDVRAWRVLRADGTLQGFFLGDYFARSGKRSGAWMSVLRPQHKMGEGQTPVVYNVCNFSKPHAGEPALLSLTDATTLFHEFGHALHGLLSDVDFPSLSGTSVSRDFVELPSQLFEHWLTVPEILDRHATHIETGEPMPRELVAKLLAARTLDAGFDTVEYTASAIVDLDLHENAGDNPNPLEIERESLRNLGMPEAIVMRHRTPHFAHVFSGEGYSAGYYSYLWSEVLDSDAFEAFGEAGDPFHVETAERLLRHVYSAGDSEDADALYRSFRGREPDPAALMRKRGFSHRAA